MTSLADLNIFDGCQLSAAALRKLQYASGID